MSSQTVTATGARRRRPYIHAVQSGGLLFCSGQIPLDPESGELVGDTPAEQARRCLENLGPCARPRARSLPTP